MKQTSYHTSDGVAPARNGSSSVTRIRTEGAAGGVPLQVQPSDGGTFAVSAGGFSIKQGGALVAARVTIDDEGFMEIRNVSGTLVMKVYGGLGDWHQTLNPTTWHGSASAFLPEGTYSVTGTVNNARMDYPKENLAYFRYEVLAQYTVTDREDEDKKKEPPTCDTCGCGTDSGNNTGNGKESTPDSPDEECGGSVSPVSAPRGGGNDGGAAPAVLALADESESEKASSTFMRYDSVWYWQAHVQDGVLTILPTSGRHMTFALVPGDSVACPAALTRHHAVRVELKNEDLSPCTSGSPAFWTLTEASGQRVRFDAQGAVAAVISASGRVTLRAEHTAQVQEHFADDGSLLSGNYTTFGEPYKTSTHLITIADSTRFYDNRPIKVYTDYQEAGSNSWLNIKVVDYTYEDSAAVERTTARSPGTGLPKCFTVYLSD